MKHNYNRSSNEGKNWRMSCDKIFCPQDSTMQSNELVEESDPLQNEKQG